MENSNYQRNISSSPTFSEASAVSSVTLINIEDFEEETITDYDSYKKSKLLFQNENKPSTKEILLNCIPSKATLKLCFLIIGWYCSSALHSNFQKKVLKLYKHPFTITYIQFFYLALYTGIGHFFKLTRIRRVSLNIIKQTLPISIFQLFGHLLNTFALSLVSVNFSQTIKALSPLFIIGIYRLIFHEHYSKQTYLSLIPLVFGVMLVCFNKSSFNIYGFICSFCSCFVFAVQNVVTKKVLSNYGSKTEKLDKLNVLFYFSSQAFILLTPWWLKVEGYQLFLDGEANGLRIADDVNKTLLIFYMVINSLFSYAQSCLAITLINNVTPVTYSIAGLIKRIFVILVSLIFFGDNVTLLQGIGITITFIGLFLYNNARNTPPAEIIKDNYFKPTNNKRSLSLRHLISKTKNVLPISNRDTRDRKSVV